MSRGGAGNGYSVLADGARGLPPIAGAAAGSPGSEADRRALSAVLALGSKVQKAKYSPAPATSLQAVQRRKVTAKGSRRNGAAGDPPGSADRGGRAWRTRLLVVGGIALAMVLSAAALASQAPAEADTSGLRAGAKAGTDTVALKKACLGHCGALVADGWVTIHRGVAPNVDAVEGETPCDFLCAALQEGAPIPGKEPPAQNATEAPVIPNAANETAGAADASAVAAGLFSLVHIGGGA